MSGHRSAGSGATVMRARWLPVLVLTLVPLLACEPQPFIETLSPENGAFTTESSIVVSGTVGGFIPAVADVTVNGTSVLPLGPAGEFSTVVTLDPGLINNPILVEVLRKSGKVSRKRVTVIAGESIADGDFSPMGIALRLNDRGLDAVEPVITGLVDLDLATLVPPGTLVINDFCYADTIFGCIGRVDVRISGSPPPSLSSFAIDIDSQVDEAQGIVTLNDLSVRAQVDDATGVPLSCTIDIDAAVTNIDGFYGLDPDLVDPSMIDVTQNGGVVVSFGSFTDATSCGGLLGGLVEALIGLFIGDIQDLMGPALEDFLNATDANGNTPIAGAIETALAGIELAGPIGESIGVNLETPLFDVFEDVNGVTLDSDARITASLPDPEAPDLLASYHVDEPFPSFGPNTPVGGLPYGLGLCISTSAFNQLLRAEVESGLLRTSLTEIDLGTGPLPLTMGVMGLVFPEFQRFPPQVPMRLDLAPTISPILTGNDGPNGEIAEMRVPQLAATLVVDAGNTVLLRLAIDVTVGLDIDFVDGELVFGLGAVAPEDVTVVTTINRLGINEALLNSLLATALPGVLPSLADSLGSFPLPNFFGLELDLVEVSKNGEFMSLFLDLTAAP